MNGLSLGLGIFNGLSGLTGMLGASAARRRAEMAQQQAITDMSASYSQQYQAMLARNAQGLSAAAGLGGDAVQSFGRRLGDALSGAGVYNSSATAGAVTQAQNDQSTQLAELASRNNFNAQDLYQRGKGAVAGMQFNLAGQQLSQANADYGDAAGGFDKFLGQLSQSALDTSGANAERQALPRDKGGAGQTAAPPADTYGSNFKLTPETGMPAYGPMPFQFQGMTPSATSGTFNLESMMPKRNLFGNTPLSSKYLPSVRSMYV